jgi:hypothetical protein
MTLSECLMYNIRRDGRVLYIRSRRQSRTPKPESEEESFWT